ncbi:hypothetical protein T02_2471 [Trichinella nativa]|uniref:Uncharacterized protein n=1 Tax=Trichinella nativa TaxID=6335 RepID=A0A0V1KL95_9BILA|nr:hypothetical protein T02_2471 [Trichinella nativa]
MAILQTFNKPGGVRRISTPMHTTLLRSPHLTSSLYRRSPYKKMLHLPRFLPIEDEDCSSSLNCSQSKLTLNEKSSDKSIKVSICICVYAGTDNICVLLVVHPTIFAVNMSETRVSFVAAKSKVAPLKKLSVP